MTIVRQLSTFQKSYRLHKGRFVILVRLSLMLVMSLLSVTACSTDTVNQAHKWQSVRIGFAGIFPPFLNQGPSGNFGWEIDYANELCKRMSVSCTFVRHSDFPSLILALLHGDYDVIFSSLAVTSQRQKQVIFSDVYYATPIVFVGRASEVSSEVSPEALTNKRIGVQYGTNFEDYLVRFYKQSQINRAYQNIVSANADLANGNLDYVLEDILVANTFIEKQGNGCCRIIAEIQRNPEVIGPGIGAAFRPQDTDLRAMFNKAIAEVDADGTYQKIASNYFKINIRGK